MAGRPHHLYWEEYGFQQIKIQGKNASLCNYCEKVLKNTAKKRLLAHRNVCKTHERSSVPSVSISVDSDTETDSNNNKQNSDDEDDLPLAKLSKLQKSKGQTENSHSNSSSNSTKTTTVIIKTARFSEADNDDDDSSDKQPQLQLEDGSRTTSECSNLLRTSSSKEASSSQTRNSTEQLRLANQNTETPRLPRSLQTISQVPSTSQKRTPGNSSRTEILGFCDKMSSKEKEDLDMALCEFMFGCNIPFSVVESDYFKKFIKRLRPASKLPTRKTLTTTLLPKCYESCKDSIKQFDKDSVMLIDGWKNSASNTKNIVCLIHNVDGDIAFLDSIDLTGERETGDKLQEIVEKCVETAKQLYKTNIYAVCSDNASNMKKMGAQIDMWYTNCNSHTANLLAKELVSENLANRVQSVLKEFSSPDHESALLKLGGKRIVLAGETRWCSYRDSFVNFLYNLKPMRTVIAEANSNFKPNITKLVFDENFKKQVEDSVKLFDPVCKLINSLQSTSASVADAAEEWLQLSLPPGFEEYIPLVIKRKEYALNVYSLAANYLHPIYKGKLLNDDQINEVEDFLFENLNAEGLEGLQNYKNNRNIFEKLGVKNITKVRTYWGLAERHYPELSRLAIKLNTIPASSAQLERLFSNWSYIHSPIRNRLTSENSKMLTYIYYHLKLKDENKSDEY